MNQKERILIVGSVGIVGRNLFKSMQRKFEIIGHDLRDRTNLNGKRVEVKADPKTCQELVMHICIPWTDNFEEEVLDYNRIYHPRLIIIHSSVKPGTTESIWSKDIPVVHSPVLIDESRKDNLPYFRKMVGYDFGDLALRAEEHLRQCFNVALINGSKNTELADICLGLYMMSSKALIFEMSRIFSMMGCFYGVMRELIDFSNYGYATLNRNDMVIHNVLPDLNKDDYRLNLIELLPEEMVSSFFKLGQRSYVIEKAMREERRTASAVEV